jgi:peroxiredoxin
MKRTVWIVLILVAVLTGGYFYNKYRIAPSVEFQSIALTDLDGRPVRLSDFQQKKLVLNFFETWCGPCVQEMPALEKAQERLRSSNFIFFSISDEPLGRLRAFVHATNCGLTVLHSERKFHDLRIFTFPTNYVLNSTGQIVFKNTGVQNWDDEAMARKLEDLCR